MLPGKYDLLFYRGDTPGVTFKIPGDHVSSVKVMQVRDGADGALLADLSSSVIGVLFAGSGQTSFTFRALTPLETAAIIAAANAVYDFQLIAGTVSRTYLRGAVTIERDISRLP